jgi:hypothetical protein
VRHPRVGGDPVRGPVSSFNKNNPMAKCILFTEQKDYMFSISDSFLKHFENLEDPRVKNNHNKSPSLIDILILTILAIISVDRFINIC